MISNDLKVGMWLIDGLRDSIITVYKVTSLNKKDNSIKLTSYEVIKGKKGTVLISMNVKKRYNDFAFIKPLIKFKDRKYFIKNIFTVLTTINL